MLFCDEFICQKEEHQTRRLLRCVVIVDATFHAFVGQHGKRSSTCVVRKQAKSIKEHFSEIVINHNSKCHMQLRHAKIG